MHVVRNKHLDHGTLWVNFVLYDKYSRLLCRILLMELLSTQWIKAFENIQSDEVADLVSSLVPSPLGQVVNVDQLLARFIDDSSVCAIFSDWLSDKATYLKIMILGTNTSSPFYLRDLYPLS